MRRSWVLALLLSGCGANCGQFQNSSQLCSFPMGVGPEGTSGQCNIGAVCLTSDLAPCTGNSCCHTFCSIAGCPTNATCLSLAPEQFADGGPTGCECVADAGCTCAPGDGGTCLRPSCLQVCSSNT